MPHQKFAIPPTMKAAVIDKTGVPDVLRYREVPTPRPGPGEVLVRVRAVSVSEIDLLRRAGREPIEKSMPHILGKTGIGTIALFGPGIKGWCEDDRVSFSNDALGCDRDGAYAEYVVVPLVDLEKIPYDQSDIASLTSERYTLLPLAKAAEAHTQYPEAPGALILIPVDEFDGGSA